MTTGWSAPRHPEGWRVERKPSDGLGGLFGPGPKTAFVPAVRAAFRVGTLAATGLADASADGVICVGAFVFDPAEQAGLAELHRILRPGARAVITSGSKHPAFDAVQHHDGLEIEEELQRPGIAAMWGRVYELWTERESDLRQHLGDAQADSMLAEARRHAPTIAGRRFSIVTIRRTG